MGWARIGAAWLAVGCACRGASSAPSCADAVTRREPRADVRCRIEFALDRDPATGAHLARALGRTRAAPAIIEPIAVAIGDMPAGAGAWNSLAEARRLAGDTDGAIVAFRRALEHRAREDLIGRIDDLIGLVGCYSVGNQFRDAMRYTAEAYELSRQPGAESRRSWVLLNAAGLAFNLGDLPLTDALMSEAEAVIAANDDNWRYLREFRGLVSIARGRYQVAVTSLEQAVAAARAAGQKAEVSTGSLNIAWAHVLAGELDAAATTLTLEPFARSPDPEIRALFTQIAIRLAVARHDVAGALAHAAAALVDPAIPDYWRTTLDAERGRALVQAGQLAAAEAALRSAVAGVERAREQLDLDAFKPWVLQEQRGPFEELVDLLARQGRVLEALEVVQRATARSLLDGLAGPGPTTQGVSAELGVAAERASGLRALAHSIRASVSVPAPAVSQVLSRLGARHVATYFRAVDRLWLLTAAHGAVRAFDLGPVETLAGAVASFVRDPDQASIADELGGRLLPIDALPAPGAPLFIATDDPIRDVSFAALRVGGTPLFERNPIAYVPSASVLAALGARPVEGSAIVLGDPTGDLAAARGEAIEVARRLGTDAHLGTAVTRASVLAASHAPMLHIAAHTEVGPTGAALRLADGTLTAGDVLDSGLAPRLVVLSSCASADARDRDELGPLATAFLAAGAATVVATRWSVEDEVAPRFARAFYAADGARDPVRAVAAAQRDLAAAGFKPSTWAAFVVIGTDESPTATKEHDHDHRTADAR